MRFAILLMIPLMPVAAQTWSAGLIVGGVVTDEFVTAQTNYQVLSRPLVLGSSVRMRTQSGWGFETGALRKPLEFEAVFPVAELTVTEHRTQASAWQFPFLVQYGRPLGELTPYLGAGGALRRLTGERTTAQECAQLAGVACVPVPALEPLLVNRNVGGLIGGFGMDINAGPFLLISPEVRYTRWLSGHFAAPRTDQNQFEVLVRIAVQFGPR